MSAATQKYKDVDALRCAAQKIEGYPEALESAFVDWLSEIWFQLSEDEMAEVDEHLVKTKVR